MPCWRALSLSCRGRRVPVGGAVVFGRLLPYFLPPGAGVVGPVRLAPLWRLAGFRVALRGLSVFVPAGCAGAGGSSFSRVLAFWGCSRFPLAWRFCVSFWRHLRGVVWVWLLSLVSVPGAGGVPPVSFRVPCSFVCPCVLLPVALFSIDFSSYSGW